MVNRFEVYLISLDPTYGHEIKKTRPCVIVSPNELNSSLKTVLIAPMTSAIHDFPSRISILFSGKTGEIALDQIRVIDKKRLKKKLGKLSKSDSEKLLILLQAIFAK